MALLEAPVASEAASEAVSRVVEVVAASEEVSIEVDLAVVVVVVDEEELATKAAEALVTEVTVVGMEALMAMLPQMHQLAQEVVVGEVLVVAAVMVEEEVEASVQDLQIVMAPGDQVVGMNLVEAAHMMTDLEDIVATATVVMVIEMEVLLAEAVAAIWSR